ncbi:MAG: PAS domain S-box protein [Devosia sp.]
MMREGVIGDELDRDALLRSIVETAPEAIFVADDEGTVVSFSPAGVTMFGISHEEIVGRSVGALLPNPHGTAPACVDVLFPATDAVIPVRRQKTRAVRASGDTFPVRLTTGRFTQDRRTFHVGFIEDITRHEEVRQRLEDAQSKLERLTRLNAFGEMASAFAHEINQSLTGAAGSTEAADLLAEQEGFASDHPIRARLSDSLSDIHRTAGIVRQIRQFLKTGEPQMRVVEANALVQEAVVLAALSADPKVRITFVPDPALTMLLVDPMQLQIIVINLITNALDAVRHTQTPAITIATHLDEAAVRVVVTDNGSGIVPTVAEHMFEPLVTTKPDGLGVGLSICRRLARAHNGAITLAPSAEGSRFVLTLPRGDR